MSVVMADWQKCLQPEPASRGLLQGPDNPSLCLPDEQFVVGRQLTSSCTVWVPVCPGPLLLLESRIQTLEHSTQPSLFHHKQTDRGGGLKFGGWVIISSGCISPMSELS